MQAKEDDEHERIKVLREKDQRLLQDKQARVDAMLHDAQAQRAREEDETKRRKAAELDERRKAAQVRWV